MGVSAPGAVITRDVDWDGFASRHPHCAADIDLAHSVVDPARWAAIVDAVTQSGRLVTYNLNETVGGSREEVDRTWDWAVQRGHIAKTYSAALIVLEPFPPTDRLPPVTGQLAEFAARHPSCAPHISTAQAHPDVRTDVWVLITDAIAAAGEMTASQVHELTASSYSHGETAAVLRWMVAAGLADLDKCGDDILYALTAG